MKVVAPTWLMYSLPSEIAQLLADGQPHRVRVARYAGDTRVELVLLPDDVADVEPVEDCCHACACSEERDAAR